MKGAPMMANTKSHGTNKNYQKSGMSQASGAPFLGKLAKGAGKLLKGAAKFGAFGPLGMVGSALMDRNKAKQGGAADPNMAPPPAAPVAQAPGTAPVDATQMEEPGMQGAAMGKHLMKGAPKTGRPRYKKESKPTNPNEKYTGPRSTGGLKVSDKVKKAKPIGSRNTGLKVSDKVKNAKPGAPRIPLKPVIKKVKETAKKVGKKIKKSRAYKGAKEVGEGFKMIGHTIANPIESIKSDIRDYKARNKK